VVAQTIHWESNEVYADRVPLSRFLRAAERQGRRDWPSPPERGGTRVQVRVNPRAASVVIIAPHAYGREPLLAVTRHLVRDFRLPASDIYAYEGHRTVGGEMDVTPAIRRAGLRVDCDLDIGRIARALLRTDLPRPIVVGVDAWNGSRVTVGHGASARPVGDDIWFADAAGFQPGDTVHFEAVFRWSAVPIGLLFLLIPLLAAAIHWYLALRKRPDGTVKDPGEVQRRYDRQPAAWLAGLLVLVPFGVIFGVGIPDAVRAADLLLPIDPRYRTLGETLVVPLSWLACWLVMRRRRPAPEAAASGTDTLFPDENVGALLARGLFLLMMPITLLLGVVLLVLGPFVRYAVAHHPEWRDSILVILPAMKALPYLALALGIWLAARGSMKAVTSGPWYRMVQDMAERAGVRVKKVVILRAKTPNAFANAFGTVGLTQGLLQKLEPEEVRAVVAHEIGHLKGRHPHKTMLATLPTLVLLWCALRFSEPLLDRVPETGVIPGALFVGMLVLVALTPVLASGRGRRQREREADALAVEWTGDPELVIRALTKLHALAGAPERLKPSDEFLSTHPSLAHRIHAIRAREDGNPTSVQPTA
jgi:Zn-dependent protease with chaperone function